MNRLAISCHEFDTFTMKEVAYTFPIGREPGDETLPPPGDLC